MSFAATDFEFKQRFWIIGGVIFLAFFCYNLDHTNIAFALTQKILGPTVNPDSPIFDRYQLAIVTIGSLFVYLAALLRSWAESYLHSSIVHDAAIHSDQLVAEGPYRYVRNPLYLGNDLLAIGLGTLASRLGFVVMVVGMFIFTYRPDPPRRSRPPRHARRKLPPLFQRRPSPLALAPPTHPLRRRQAQLARRPHRRNLHVEHSHRHDGLRSNPAHLDVLARNGRRLRHLLPASLPPQASSN